MDAIQIHEDTSNEFPIQNLLFNQVKITVRHEE